MKRLPQFTKPAKRDDELYQAFLGLDRNHRTRVALRILRNQRVLADLYDHLLIQQALRERGRSTTWANYLHREDSAGR